MNSFLQEVITQGDYLKKTAAYYRSEGAEAMRQITDLFHEKKMNRVVLTGMGSSLYAMDTVLSYLTGHGIPALSHSEDVVESLFVHTLSVEISSGIL